MTTGFLYDPRFLEHDTGAGHPECRARLEAAMRHLDAQPWFGDLRRYTPRMAAREWLMSVHAEDYIVRAQATCEAGQPFLDTLDVAVSPSSFDIALLAAGGALELADRVVAREIDSGFALLRPPGHHAEHSSALGFCLFNNIAILARYLQREHGLDKILILDWDVHHGNGTQHTFEEDPSVLYVSTHQYPYYPGTGAAYETGNGRGRGATLNCPMPAGATDDAYQRAFMEVILPRVNHFKPEAVLLSAGFDAHRDDPLAQINLSEHMFGWMTARMLEAADQHAGGRVVSLLEGGYNLQMLPVCIAEHLKVLAGAAGA
ncbi:MAG: histone deacetylase [Gammaproteobacteria bacterium]|nr:histone deacetylase [Gammaproteobacteria bacterium]